MPWCCFGFPHPCAVCIVQVESVKLRASVLEAYAILEGLADVVELLKSRPKTVCDSHLVPLLSVLPLHFQRGLWLALIDVHGRPAHSRPPGS